MLVPSSVAGSTVGFQQASGFYWFVVGSSSAESAQGVMVVVVVVLTADLVTHFQPFLRLSKTLIKTCEKPWTASSALV